MHDKMTKFKDGIGDAYIHQKHPDPVEAQYSFVYEDAPNGCVFQMVDGGPDYMAPQEFADLIQAHKRVHGRIEVIAGGQNALLHVLDDPETGTKARRAACFEFVGPTTLNEILRRAVPNDPISKVPYEPSMT